MEIDRYRKVFGVGPSGAVISLVLFAIAWWVDLALGHLTITIHSGVTNVAAAILITTGAALHVWTFITLKKWWSNSRLCAGGPFRWFRHPMYAAWITFITLGICLFLNSWVFVGWYLLLHPIWHRLVIKEEMMMADHFGDAYRQYRVSTGRFFPKF